MSLVLIYCIENIFNKPFLLCFRIEGDGYVQYKAMVICTGMHLLLLMFEILACDNLESRNHSWILVFIPLMFMSVVSIGICIWAVKNERSFEVSALVTVINCYLSSMAFSCSFSSRTLSNYIWKLHFNFHHLAFFILVLFAK